jgi:predicted RNase H-like HicB family nuclease
LRAAADTLDATERLIRDAIEFHLEGMRAHGDPIHDPTTVVQYVEAPAA